MPRLFVPLAATFCLLACFSTTFAADPAKAASPLILVSIDGYRADYIGRGASPTLVKLADDGVRAEALRPAFPSVTFPNHYTLVTGLYPDHHGIINNTMHDAVLGDFTPAGVTPTSDGRWWEQAEPIWITAERHGRRTASMFWPGTPVEIKGMRPTYWQAFNPSVSADARVDQVLEWLDLPAERRPSFVLLYFDGADVAGHNYGPDSPEVQESLVTIDAALGRLVDGLRKRNQYDRTNLVIVSDHGMSASSPDRTVLLDDLVNVEHIQLESALTVAGLNPKPEYTDEVEHALLTPHPHLQCWKKGDLPAKFHYGSNARIPAILCVAEDGWMVSTAALESKRKRPLLGEHGYDNDDPQMRALFVAHGPAFRQHLVVPEFDNIHVYALLAKLMGIDALPNDGNANATAGMLRPAKH